MLAARGLFIAKKPMKSMMNLNFWTNTINLKTIGYREVCKQVEPLGKKGRGPSLEASSNITLCDQFLPALQLSFGSGLADNHIRLWPYKESQSKACVLHLHLTLGSNDGCKKTMQTLCVPCNFNPQSTCHWKYCLSLEKYWTRTTPLSFLSNI